MDLEPRTQAPAHATGAVDFVPLSAIAEDATFRLREEGDVSALAASLGRLGQLLPLELRPLPGAGPGAPRYQVVSGFRRAAALRLLRRDRALARIHAALSDEDAWGLALSQALLTEPLDRAAVDALRARLEPSGVAPWALELLDEALVRAPVEPELRERFLEYLGAPEAAGPLPLTLSLSKGERGGEAQHPSDDLGLDGAEAPEEAAETAELAAMDGGPEDAVAEETPGPDGAEAGASQEQIEVTPEELATDLAARMYEVNADLALAWEAWADLPPEGRVAIVEQARWVAELLHMMEQEPEEQE